MALFKTKTDGTHVTIFKPSHIYAQMLDDKGNAAGNIFDFEEVLRDTTTLSQDDNDTSEIENEVSDDPIKSLVTLGSFQFATTIEDIQADIVKSFCGFEEDPTTELVFAPAQYTEKHAVVVVVVPNGTKNVALIMPDLQLNTRMIIESLNSSLLGVNLQGTAQSKTITMGSGTDAVDYKTPMVIDYDYALPTNATTDLGALRSTAPSAGN